MCANGRSYDPPAQNLRQKTGQHNAKVGRKENKETETKAVARKQEPLPVQKILLWLVLFGAVCACVYTYLNYVLSDEEDEEMLAAEAAAAAAKAKLSAAAAASDAG